MWRRIASVLVCAIACSPLPTTKPICTPGQSIACVGAGSCAGYQVCADDGTTFDACMCEPPVDASFDAPPDVTDASSESDQQAAEAEAGLTWTPASLGSALAIWFDADVGFSTNGWKDQSGNGNDATPVNQQSSWMFQQYGNELNGHSAIRCPGNGTYFSVKDSASLHWGTADWTLVFITKLTLAQSTLWQQDNSTSTFLWVTFSGADIDERVGNTDDTLLYVPNYTVYHAFVVRGPHLGITSDDGTFAYGPTTSIDVSNVGAGAQFGIAGQVNGALMLAEIIGIHGTMSNADSIALGTYLHEKYAF